MPKNKFTYLLLFFILFLSTFSASANSQNEIDSIEWHELDDFVITKKRPGIMALSGAENAFRIDQTQLFKAACCNLGESFTTNPSVDVSYSDAATGAKQVKLLGLSGNYVQLLTENMPAFRGAAKPYALRYVPGPWIKSINVSKGNATVKNGFESITGQIDVDYLKPQTDPTGVALNAYFDSDLKLEANADANFHVSPTLNTIILGHFEDRFMNHDANNDGFTDMPDIRQFNFMNRWNLFTDKYIFHGGLSYINEKSEAGQLSHHSSHSNPYRIDMLTNRGDFYMKHAFILNKERNTNIALMANGNFHDLDATYGIRGYDVKEWNAYAQLMFETDFNEKNNLSAGLSYNYDYLNQHLVGNPFNNPQKQKILEKENTFGAYAQYTWKPSEKFTAMAGVRGDHSSMYGFFVTPRLNLMYSPTDQIMIKASAGKGYRTVFAWAEYNYLLASSRALVVENLNQESSWNYGLNFNLRIPINAETIRFGAEYHYTHFDRQVIIDYETPHVLSIGNLEGKSYANTFQIEASYESSFGLTATAAWRLNDVRTTYQGKLLEKPFSSKYKGLLTVSYSTPMDIWQFDLTCALNGGGRMPAPYKLADGSWSWSERFPTYPTLNFQVTRWFRHFSIYAGGENLTNYKQKNPIISATDPWGPDFDTTMVWGPISGAMAYVGIRFNFGKL